MENNFSKEAYSALISSLSTLYPSFGTVGAAAYKPGLERMLQMCSLMGNPQNAYPCIHVAGTNGKGSTCNMLAAHFAAKGLKVGLYTSPHILDFRERARVVMRDGWRLVGERFVWDFLTGHAGDFKALGLSYFEITTALAFAFFAAEKVDIAIIETGLGGRLDATNIVTPKLSIITNIGLDHMDILGDTVEKIAAEKAGIMKRGVPALVGEWDSATAPVFAATASSLPCELHFADRADEAADHASRMSGITDVLTDGVSLADVAAGADAFADGADAFADRVDEAADHASRMSGITDVLTDGVSLTDVAAGADAFADRVALSERVADGISGADLDLQGTYQRKNLRTVLSALRLLGEIPCPDALKHAAAICGFHGRWEQICDSPLTICDIGHNAHGLKYNFAQLESMLSSGQISDLVMVYGSVSDKDVDAVVRMLPVRAFIYYTAAANQRALSAEALCEKAVRLRPGIPHSNPQTPSNLPAHIPGCDISADVSCHPADISVCTTTTVSDSDGMAVPNVQVDAFSADVSSCSTVVGSSRGIAVPNVREAVRLALERCKTLPRPLLYIGGSTYVVAEALPLFR